MRERPPVAARLGRPHRVRAGERTLPAARPGHPGARVDQEERNFAHLWADRAARAIVLDVPDAVRRDLLRFLPAGDPARLTASGPPPAAGRGDGESPPPSDGAPPPPDGVRPPPSAAPPPAVDLPRCGA